MGRKAAVKEETTTETPFDFTKSGQKFNDVERFCSFWANYPDQDGLKAYLYRLAPVIDCRQSGNKFSYIDTFDTPVDPGEFLRRRGSGKYEIKLSDAKKPSPHSQVARCIFNLEDPDVPAVFNPSDLVVVGEPGIRNRPLIERYLSQGYVIAENQKNAVYLDKNKQEIPFSCLLPVGSAGASGAERELAETVRHLSTERAAAESAASGSRDALVSQLLSVILANQRAPVADPLENAFKIAERLKPPAVDSTQVELLKVIASLAKPQETAAAAAAVNPLETTRATLAMMKEMGWAAPGSGDSGGGGFWTAVFGALPSIIDVLRPGLAALAAYGAGAPAGGRVPAAAPAVAALPAVLPAGGGVQPSGPLPGGGVVGEEMEGDEMLGFGTLMQLGEDALDAFTRGLTGADFAHGLCCRKGGEKSYALLYKLGKATLLQALSMAQNAPQLSAEQKALLLAKKGEIESFIDSFLSYADTPAE